jgi:ribosomal protein S18 acetylase RimI-like enzyme
VLKSFVVDILNEETYRLALRSVVKAMDFVKYYGNEQEIEEWIAKSIEMFYRKDRFHCVGIKEIQEEEYLGFSSLIPLETTGWIPYVGVEPEYQGYGLGKKLIVKTLEIAKEIGLETIELCSSQKGFQFYQSLNFEANFPVIGYDIIKTKKKNENDLQIDTQIPNWILKMDREVVGIDRENLFHIHNYRNLTIINDPHYGYGFLYNKRIGPIIANSLPLAQEIILKGVELGATSCVLVEDTALKKKINEVVHLKPQVLMENTKMTYGVSLKQDLDKLYGFRSVAYG